jgi:hypothetical protein
VVNPVSRDRWHIYLQRNRKAAATPVPQDFRGQGAAAYFNGTARGGGRQSIGPGYLIAGAFGVDEMEKMDGH